MFVDQNNKASFPPKTKTWKSTTTTTMSDKEGLKIMISLWLWLLCTKNLFRQRIRRKNHQWRIQDLEEECTFFVRSCYDSCPGMAKSHCWMASWERNVSMPSLSACVLSSQHIQNTIQRMLTAKITTWNTYIRWGTKLCNDCWSPSAPWRNQCRYTKIRRSQRWGWIRDSFW